MPKTKILTEQTIKIPKEALRRGVVLLDLEKYKSVIFYTNGDSAHVPEPIRRAASSGLKMTSILIGSIIPVGVWPPTEIK